MESEQNQPVLKEDEDEENEEEEDSEESSSNEDEGSVKKAVQALTCRKVTLNMLMDDGLIEAGESVLTIDYLGQKFEADLLPSGKIKWQGSEEEFGTPSAWALHCKRLVNPIKRSGCGWASVKYKNKKLDIWKSIWARKQRLSSSSKSPQISPGLRLSSSSSSIAEQPAHSSGLASPTGPKRASLPTAGLASPTAASGVAASPSTSSSPIGATATGCPPSQSVVQASSVAMTPSDTGSDAVKATPPLSSTPLNPKSVTEVESPSKPEIKKAPDVASSEEQTQQQTASTKDQGMSDQNSTEVAALTKASAAASVKEDQPGSTNSLSSSTMSTNQPSSGAAAQSTPATAGDDHSPPKKAKHNDSFSLTLSRELPSPTPGPLPPRAILQQPVRAAHGEIVPERSREQAWEGFQLQQQQQLQSKKRSSVLYSSLGQRGLDVDPFTLIKCEHFDSLSKIQPFTVSVTSNTLLLMDFHCHLTKSEVVGYLGGRWDCQRQHLSIEQAFPAKCRLGDKDRSSVVEEEIRRSMRQRGMMVVGWYHSHPTCPPDPSLRDLDCQMAYQLRMRGSGAIYLPCVGFILSPFEKFPPKQDSKIQAYWVMPNLEHPTSFNIPMHVTHSIVRDSSLTEDLLSDLKSLCEFYSGAVDRVRLREHWGEAITYMDKIKASLRSKLPEDQLDSSTFLDYVQQLLGDMK